MTRSRLLAPSPPLFCRQRGAAWPPTCFNSQLSSASQPRGEAYPESQGSPAPILTPDPTERETRSHSPRPLNHRAGSALHAGPFQPWHGAARLAGVPEGWPGHLHLPSGGSRPLGPEGWKPPRAHSIICLFCTSTALAVSLSSLSWQAGNSFPARLLATWRQHAAGRV